MELNIAVILLIDVLVAIFFGNIAKKKGYPYLAWGIIGFFFPILYLIILLLPNRVSKQISNNDYSKKKEEINHDDDSVDEQYQVEKKDNDNNNRILIVIIIVGLLITIPILNYIFSYSTGTDSLKDFKDNIIDDTAEAYIYFSTNNFTNSIKDERVYIKDLYDLHSRGKLDEYQYYLDIANFDEIWNEYYDEIYDDYIVIINEGKDDANVYWNAFYYDEFDEEEEMSDYVLNSVIEKYEQKVTNNYQIDVKTETVFVHDLFNNGYITSDYFKKIYEKNKQKLNDDYVKSIGQGGKMYDATYYFE